MKDFVVFEEAEGFPVASIREYCNAEVGDQINRWAEELLRQGKKRIILDFSQCKFVNSPGIAAMLALSLKAVDDNRARLVITGYSSVVERAFTLATIFPRAEKARTPQEALKLLSGK